jgi:ketosteroid isomerase-like protein
VTTIDVAEVEAVNSEFYAAFESTDYDLMGALWVDGALARSAACVHPGWAMLHGRQAIMRSWAVIFANTTYIQFVLTDVTTEVSGSVAVVTCVENILTSMSGESGEDPSGPGALGGGRVAATNVFRRTDTGWRMWLHHGSPVLETSDDDEPPEEHP